MIPIGRIVNIPHLGIQGFIKDQCVYFDDVSGLPVYLVSSADCILTASEYVMTNEDGQSIYSLDESQLEPTSDEEYIIKCGNFYTKEVADAKIQS